MNWDDPKRRPPTRDVLRAAVCAFVNHQKMLNELVGDALPGSYQSYNRRGWYVVDVYDEPHLTTLYLAHPDPVFFNGCSADDLVQAKEAMCADGCGVDSRGRLWVSYDF